MIATIPGFARVEIRLNEKADLVSAAMELRRLAVDLETIAGQRRGDEEAVILAHHKIRSTSKRTRK